MASSPILVWFRQDLRLKANPALLYAIEKKAPILPVYIWSPEEEAPWKLGGASCWWLHHSLKALEAELKERGLRLQIERGRADTVLRRLVKKTKAAEVVWNFRYEPHGIAQEKRVASALEKLGCFSNGFHGNLLFPPGSVLTGQETPYQVFTPFYHACLNEEVELPKGKIPQQIPSPRLRLPSFAIDELKLLPQIGWDKGFYPLWRPGEKGALAALKVLSAEKLRGYAGQRDFPAIEGTSQLSAHLHFGEISPAQIWDVLQKNQKASVFLRQIVWREFAYHLLVHFPKTPLRPLKEKFKAFPWKRNRTCLKAWQQGKTGFPLIDAGMRQLRQTGWMHNRVRMVAASFLVKDLMIPWQEGAKWFWDTLVDADLANNTFGWQWCAGCGADAAPYFRIFNPFTQSRRFDPEGAYIRHFVPELRHLSDRWVHSPHLAPENVLKEAGIVLGKTYPYPLVDHDKARREALKAYVFSS